MDALILGLNPPLAAAFGPTASVAPPPPELQEQQPQSQAQPTEVPAARAAAISVRAADPEADLFEEPPASLLADIAAFLRSAVPPPPSDSC